MKTKNNDHLPGIDELENKAKELTYLMFSRCEERMHNVAFTDDAHTTSLTSAYVAVRSAIGTFLAVDRTLPTL